MRINLNSKPRHRRRPSKQSAGVSAYPSSKEDIMLEHLHNNPQLIHIPNTKPEEITVSYTQDPSQRGRKKNKNPPSLKATASPHFTIRIDKEPTPHAEAGNPAVGTRTKGRSPIDQNANKISKLERTNKKLEEENQKLQLQLQQKGQEMDKILEQMGRMSSTIQHLTTRIDLQEARETIREQKDTISQLRKEIWQQKPM